MVDIAYILNPNNILTGSTENYHDYFHNLSLNNQLLTTDQLDKLIKILSKKSLFVKKYNKIVVILKSLTDKHVLSVEQVDTVLSAYDNKKDYNSCYFESIDNLLKNGYQLTDQQIDILCHYKYENVQTLIINKDNGSLNDLNRLCLSLTSYKNYTNVIKSFIDKYKIVPDASTVNCLLQKYNNNEPNNYIDKFTINIINILIDAGLVVNMDVFKQIYGLLDYSKMLNHVEKLFVETPITSLSEINFVFDVLKYIKLTGTNCDNLLNYLNIISVILKLAEKHNCNFEIECLYKFIIPFYFWNDKLNMRALNSYIYIFGYNTYDSILDEIRKTYTFIIEKFMTRNNNDKKKIYPLLEHVCKQYDELGFDIIINRINGFSNKCVLIACSKGSEHMLTKFINMKFIPTIEHARLLPLYAKSTFICLISNGLKVNNEIIELGFKKYIYIDNLQIYDYQTGIDLYKLCYKYDVFPDTYITQLRNNPDVHIDLRLNIYYCDSTKKKIGKIKKSKFIDSEADTIKYIETKSVVVDQMMYDHAVVANKPELVAFFEQKHNMKPNYDALIRIPDFETRRIYLEKLNNNK